MSHRFVGHPFDQQMSDPFVFTVLCRTNGWWINLYESSNESSPVSIILENKFRPNVLSVKSPVGQVSVGQRSCRSSVCRSNVCRPNVRSRAPSAFKEVWSLSSEIYPIFLSFLPFFLSFLSIFYQITIARKCCLKGKDWKLAFDSSVGIIEKMFACVQPELQASYTRNTYNNVL